MNNKKGTVRELSEYLNISEAFIRKLIREAKIPYIKIEGKILFDYNTIDNWISTKSNLVQVENNFKI